ncbi:MAG: TetR/AcrR family transcriptional regulator [Sciscionella sp.]|nr:TetR/AcrR family transcriptional regulator [Sciscionella sp.]
MPRRTQHDRSASTKAALITAGRALFAERGYAGVPADDIVKAAGVTRGALYHHFGDKLGLFRAVYDELGNEIDAELRPVLSGDVATAMLAGLATFLDICDRAEVRQLVLIDAPAVFGYRQWRAIEAEYGLGMITELILRGIEEKAVVPQRVDVLAQLVFAASIEAALIIANAEDPAATRVAVEGSLAVLFAGLLLPPS